VPIASGWRLGSALDKLPRMATGQDPGWGPVWRRPSLWLPIPFTGTRPAKRAQRRGAIDGLTAHRAMFLRFVVALVAFGIILPFVGAGTGSAPTALFVGLVIAAGVASVAVPKAIKRPLDCSSEGKLVATYRVRFFLRVAYAEAVALFGFVGAFITDAVWLYYFSLLCAAVGFARLAPTTRNLSRDQQALYAGGCSLSLVAALTRMEPPS
jgi:F0F1-type ATP synthase membrane subunit c/vacuolar-type H+-ATPase subunit K